MPAVAKACLRWVTARYASAGATQSTNSGRARGASPSQIPEATRSWRRTWYTPPRITATATWVSIPDIP